MTVRGCETVDGRTVDPGQFGGFLQVGNLFDVRLGELRVVHRATLPVAFEG